MSGKIVHGRHCVKCGAYKGLCRFPWIRNKRKRNKKCKQCLLVERLEEAENGIG